MIVVKIGNIYTDIEGEVPEWSKLERLLSFRPEGYLFTPAYNKWILNDQGQRVRRVWDGWKRQCWKGKKRTYFPTGLMSIARDYFITNNIPYKVIDYRTKPTSVLNLSFAPGIGPYPYQSPVILAGAKTTRGIIEAATGSGKTIISAGIIKELGVSPFLFFVTSIDLLTQAKESFEKFLLLDGKPLRVGQLGGGEIDIKDINVVTIQTAVRALGKQWDQYKFDDEDRDDKTPIEERKEDIKELLHSAKGCICDEVQHWRADTCQLVARELHNAYYTFGCSATPERDQGDDMMIQACFGKKFAEIKASRLIQEINPDTKQSYLIRPHIKMVHVKGKRSIFKTYQSIYKEQVVENRQYNEMIAKIANAYIKNGRLVLILIRQIDHGKTLAATIPGSLFLSGTSSKKAREQGINKLREKEISCIIATSIFDEGIDVRPLDTVILASQGKSKTRAMQRVGRIMRPFAGKTKATAIDFVIHQKYLLTHANERRKMYSTEPEYYIEDITP